MPTVATVSGTKYERRCFHQRDTFIPPKLPHLISLLLLCHNSCEQEEPVLIFDAGISQMYSFCFQLDSQLHEEEEELVRSAERVVQFPFLKQ